jgi:hypothetical protein
MKKLAVLVVSGVLAAPLAALAETWENVSVIDTSCLAKVKARPDEHTVQCALQCAKGGYGLLTADGAYLKFDASGNEKTAAALKATKKTDHIRAKVVGERQGDVVKVTSVTLD